ncbi:MAG: Asp23/Gls24 family envelope stress response protein [Chloroflexi bacterium]|nr:Asp23/Gls24 family envelope stress response protein [Chloroflexota bacterium]
MEPSDSRPGATTIAPDVLLTIARLEALNVEGVVGISPVPGGVNRLFKRGVGDGVRIELIEHRVTADLYLVLRHDTNLRQVSRNVQARVARAIEDIVGMQVTAVNIHIEDVAFEPA